MQRIYPCPLTPEAYHQSEYYRMVVPDTLCPLCEKPGSLHRHGTYPRWIVSSFGLLLRILIARFLCQGCGRTLSYLPEFALTYRLLEVETFEAFMNGRGDRPDVMRYLGLLQSYRRRLHTFSNTLIQTVGSGLGTAPPLSKEEVWPWLQEAGENLKTVTRHLIVRLKITLFRRYRCHQSSPL